MGTKALNRRLDRVTPDENDGDYIFSEAGFRRAVKATDRFLEKWTAYYSEDVGWKCHRQISRIRSCWKQWYLDDVIDVTSVRRSAACSGECCLVEIAEIPAYWLDENRIDKRRESTVVA